jgi:hypothetical protein
LLHWKNSLITEIAYWHGFRWIHLVDNISVDLDALRGDGTSFVLSDWHDGDKPAVEDCSLV